MTNLADEPTVGTNDLPQATPTTPTALNSIDELLRQYFVWVYEAGAQDRGDLPELTRSFKQSLEAHIAEHYVPKAEVKELEQLALGPIRDGKAVFNVSELEALIQDAVRAELEAISNRMQRQINFPNHFTELKGFLPYHKATKLGWTQAKRVVDKHIKALNTKGDTDAQ